MDILFCPLEPAWGTWTDLLNALIAFFVGLAVWGLGRRTNTLGEAANRTADQATALEEANTKRRDLREKNERQLLLIYLVYEINTAADKLEELKVEFGASDFIARYSTDITARQEAMAKVKAIDFSLTKSKFDSLYIIGNPAAAGIVRAIGTLEAVHSNDPMVSEFPPTEDARKLLRQMAMIYRSIVNHSRSDIQEIIDAASVAIRESGIRIGAITTAEIQG